MPASPDKRRQINERGETAPSLKLFTATQSYLTASFRALPETNAGTLAAAIFDFVTGLWVTAGTLSAVVHFEGTETNQLYSFTFFQRLSNSSQVNRHG
ncbi:Uncharacterised protein [Kluyvera intermedia]|nr:Uncharacterised protein [Kluyvera intermedia]